MGIKSMTVKKSKKILRYIAEYSSPKFALIIRKRNRSLLKNLNKLYKIFQTVKNPTTIIRTLSTKYGCPHCDHCSTCLYTISQHLEPNMFNACVEVNFGGYTLYEVNHLSYFSITYQPEYEKVSCYFAYDSCEKEGKEDYLKCKKFLEAHIDWTYWKCWGKKYAK